jgi:hypothetical protein
MLGADVGHGVLIRHALVSVRTKIAAPIPIRSEPTPRTKSHNLSQL